MDTAKVVSGGRRGRPNYPIEFKRRLAVEACEPGVSVAKLALRYGLNTNMVFKWRRQYRAGQFDTHSDAKAVGTKPLFLPVIAGPVAGKPSAMKAAASPQPGYIEIIHGQTSVRVCGDVTASALHLVLDCLAARE
ncbi:MAG: transposase [Dechloromonas sp.]|nr:transposase [Dechloromonas sp.]